MIGSVRGTIIESFLKLSSVIGIIRYKIKKKTEPDIVITIA